MVGGSGHHSVYADSRQYPQKEQSVLRSRAVHLSTGKQQLSLPRRPATQLRWPERPESYLYLYRNPQTLWGVFAKTAMHYAAFRCLAIHMHEPARQRARELVDTPEFANAQRQRKKVEALFAELKNQIGLRRLRLRRMKFVREQFFLAAAAQNIKRLVRFLSQGSRSILPATT